MLDSVVVGITDWLLEQSWPFWAFLATLFAGLVPAAGIVVRDRQRKKKRNSLREDLRNELRSIYPHIYEIGPPHATVAQ